MTNSDDGNSREAGPIGEDGVRIVSRSDARNALRTGQAVGRRTLAGQVARAPQAPADDPTQQMPRFPLPASGSPTSVLQQRVQMTDERPAKEIIDLRDESGDQAPDSESNVETSSGTLPHWSEGPAAVEGEAERTLFDDLGAASGLGYGQVIGAGDGNGNDDNMMDAPVDQSDKPDDDGSDRSEEGARARAVALGSSPSLIKRVFTGLAVAAAALGAFAGGPKWVLALTTVLLLLAAAEVFDALRRVGFKPATLLALVATAGTILGAYAQGEAAIALMVALMTAFTFLWYLSGITKAAPTSNIAVTVMAYLWVGVLGAFAALLLRMPDHRGMAFLIGAVLVTIAYDTGAYLGGSVLGRRPLAPSVSPTKTWEGLAAGTICAVAVGALLVQLISPWGVVSGLVLGLVVAVVAPVGDLAESMVKRDLGLKDMGRILPGHGGILDRFDALLFVLPATYYLVRVLNLG